MVTVLVQVTVEDFDTFYSGFESRGYPLREKHGSKGSRIFRHADDDHIPRSCRRPLCMIWITQYQR